MYIIIREENGIGERMIERNGKKNTIKNKEEEEMDEEENVLRKK